LALARDGLPKQPFYLTGQVGGKPFSVHAEGERVILTAADGRQEVDLVPPAPAGSLETSWPEPICPAGVVTGPEGFEEPLGPGESPLDQGLEQVRQALDEGKEAGHE
jgi:hypothetical protein